MNYRDNHCPHCGGSGDTCHRCHKGCRPACYAHNMWDIQVDPMDPTKWNVVADGVLHVVNAPQMAETATSLTANFSKPSLVYKGETDTYEIPGKDLGKLIGLEDLRDVDFDPDFEGMCAELVFRKFNDCGEGCQSAANQWMAFNLNSQDAKQNGISYVRGANRLGCPIYLDQPPRTDQYWYGMWRPTDSGNGTEFGYIQPTPVATLPTNPNGETIVISQDSNGKPVVGPINVQIQQWLDESRCTYWIPAPGYQIAPDGANSFCYFPNRGVAKCGLDIFVTSAKAGQVLFDEHIATLADQSFWPAIGDGGFYDFPCHWIWENNSDGAIIPVMYRINNRGQLLMSGRITTRTATGKTAFIVSGLDSTLDYSARGPF